MSKISAIIQARMGSTRLPQKVMTIVQGQPLLWYVVSRVKAAEKLDDVIVATTDLAEDDVIANFCQQQGLSCYRGSRDDVLDRYYQAARMYEADRIVRITADCPLIDPQIIDEVVGKALETKADYVSNTNPPTFPDGMDVEVFTFSALEREWRDAKFKYQREHVTSYITENPEIFSLVNVACTDELSKIRLTVDYPEDLAVIEHVVGELYKDDSIFGIKEIVELLKQYPELLQMTSGHIRNEVYNTEDK